MKTIVVATDLSARSNIAVERALLLAAQHKATLHIVHFIDAELPQTIAKAHSELAKNILSAWAEKYAPDLGVTAIVDCAFGDLLIALPQYLNKVDADLAVLGAHRPRGSIVFFRSTTLHRLLKRLERPLLVVVNVPKGNYAEPLVGIDFSTCSKHAAYLARDIAPYKPLIFAHVFHVPFQALNYHVAINSHEADTEVTRCAEDAKTQMDAFSALLEITTKVDTIVEDGTAATTLPSIAKRLGCDLICVGAHSRSWLPQTILGSTAEALLAVPEFDVLIAPLRAN